MRVIALPKAGISYNDSFYKAVEALGVEVIEGVFSGGWLNANVRSGDWLHLHWPAFGYAVQGGRLALLKAFIRWLALLLLVRAKGARVLWTAHNLLPHDRAIIRRLDVIGRHIVIGLSERIFIHGEHAAAALVARFPAARRKLVKVPHGNWIGYYPLTTTRDAARAELGVANQEFLYLFIGLCKPYKNLDGLVGCFRSMPAQATLIVAGKFPDRDYYDRVVALAEGDRRIRFHPGFVADEKMQTYLLACDAVVVPYREILTSGTAMLALSFGRPVVSVALGFLKDVVNDNAGLLYAADDPAGMPNALRKAMELHFDEQRVLNEARRYTFADAASLFVAALGGTAMPNLVSPPGRH